MYVETIKHYANISNVVKAVCFPTLTSSPAIPCNCALKWQQKRHILKNIPLMRAKFNLSKLKKTEAGKYRHFRYRCGQLSKQHLFRGTLGFVSQVIGLPPYTPFEHVFLWKSTVCKHRCNIRESICITFGFLMHFLPRQASLSCACNMAYA